MRRCIPSFVVVAILFSIAIGAGMPQLQAQFGNSPEAVAARQKQLAVEAALPSCKSPNKCFPSWSPATRSVKQKGSPRIQKATCSCIRAPATAVSRGAPLPRNCSSLTKT